MHKVTAKAIKSCNAESIAGSQRISALIACYGVLAMSDEQFIEYHTRCEQNNTMYAAARLHIGDVIMACYYEKRAAYHAAMLAYVTGGDNA